VAKAWRCFSPTFSGVTTTRSDVREVLYKAIGRILTPW